MKKILASLRNFAHLSSIQGYERIGITANEVKGITASTAFEVSAYSGSAAPAGAGEYPRSETLVRANDWVKTVTSPAGQGTPARTFAVLN